MAGWLQGQRRATDSPPPREVETPASTADRGRRGQRPRMGEAQGTHPSSPREEECAGERSPAPPEGAVVTPLGARAGGRGWLLPPPPAWLRAPGGRGPIAPLTTSSLPAATLNICIPLDAIITRSGDVPEAADISVPAPWGSSSTAVAMTNARTLGPSKSAGGAPHSLSCMKKNNPELGHR